MLCDLSPVLSGQLRGPDSRLWSSPGKCRADPPHIPRSDPSAGTARMMAADDGYTEVPTSPAWERFGVSAASVSRWRALGRAQGDPGPQPMGGDQRSRHIEVQGELILSLYEAAPTPPYRNSGRRWPSMACRSVMAASGASSTGAASR
jgi:hypothetical protein